MPVGLTSFLMPVCYVTAADGAAAEKNRLEEKQRMTRKDRKRTTTEWQPRYSYHYTGRSSL